MGRSSTIKIALAITAVALGTFGAAAFGLNAVTSRVLFDVHQSVAQATVTTAESMTGDLNRTPDTDRQAILSLIQAHRRGASAEWHAVLAEAIHTESTLADVDPLMVASIVAKESSFKSRIVSTAGAVGLMQLRPFVAEDVALRGKVEWSGVQTLHRPDLNVRLGILYYKELVDRFEGNPHIALTAYNQGPTRVSRNIKRGTYTGSDYATQILGLYESIRNRSAALKT